MNCPRCGLINPPGAGQCDCGYEFATGQIQVVPGRGVAGLPLASLGERLAGQMLDGLVANGGLLLGIFITSHLGITSAPAWILSILYLLFSDGIGGGQSLGKKLVGVAVIDTATGKASGHLASLVRNAFMVFGIFDWIFIFGKNRQRLGDKAAGTAVIKLHRR